MANGTLLKLASTVGTTLVILLLDWLLLVHLTAHGLALKVEEVRIASFSLQVPLQWLPIIGLIIVSLAAWYEVSSRILPRWGGVKLDLLVKLRLARAALVSVVLFASVLYIPYVVGSNWFWTMMSGLSKSFSQLNSFALSMLRAEEPYMALNPLWKYSISQVLGAGTLMLVAAIFGRRARLPTRRR